MIKPSWIVIKLTQEHKAKICLDMICEFLQLTEEELTYEKPNYNVEDYCLKQFQWWVGKMIPTDKDDIERYLNGRLKRKQVIITKRPKQ